MVATYLLMFDMIDAVQQGRTAPAGQPADVKEPGPERNAPGRALCFDPSEDAISRTSMTACSG